MKINFMDNIVLLKIIIAYILFIIFVAIIVNILRKLRNRFLNSEVTYYKKSDSLCSKCEKRGGFDCPPSNECYSLDFKPHFKGKGKIF